MVARIRLAYVQIEFLILVLRRGWCTDDSRINVRFPTDLDAIGFQILEHVLEQRAAKILPFQ